MTGRLKIHLKAHERIFVNGAVLKVDRKVAVELLNDVVFLLEGHVMRQDEATTPLRQLYFVVQSMLMDPQGIDLTRQIYDQSHRRLMIDCKSPEVLDGLVAVEELIERGRTFEALKRIRAMFPIEDRLTAAPVAPAEQDHAVA